MIKTLTEKLLPGVPLIESPFFDEDGPELLTDSQLAIAKQLRENGYAIFDFREYDDEIEGKIDGVVEDLRDRYDWEAWRAGKLKGLRIQDAWRFDARVKDIATNEGVLELLSALYLRKAIPFQTLNFPVGTEQAAHSDHAHFNSVPERFMCGVWLAFEDVDETNGPLFYYPGSQKWQSFQNEHLGVGYDQITSGYPAYSRFVELWEGLARQEGLQREIFKAKKGQALIWSSNLLHGGSPQLDKSRTRWSQVTHYFFENCIYTTPVANDSYQGKIEFRQITDVRNGNLVPHRISGNEIRKGMLDLENLCNFQNSESNMLQKLENAVEEAQRSPFSKDPGVPGDFDVRRYFCLNPDVLAADADPYRHFVTHGLKEGRQY